MTVGGYIRHEKSGNFQDVNMLDITYWTNVYTILLIGIDVCKNIGLVGGVTSCNFNSINGLLFHALITINNDEFLNEILGIFLQTFWINIFSTLIIFQDIWE